MCLKSVGGVFCFVLFFKKRKQNHIFCKKHLDFNKTELAVSVLDDLEHSLTRGEEGEEEAEAGALCPNSHSGAGNLAGWLTPPGAQALQGRP